MAAFARPGTSSSRRTCWSSAPAREGWAVAAEDGVTVALDTEIDEELDRERRVYELIRRVNTMRKDAGLELTDRIASDDSRRR